LVDFQWEYIKKLQIRVAFIHREQSSNHKGRAFGNNSHMYTSCSIILKLHGHVYILMNNNTIKEKVFEEQKDNSKTYWRRQEVRDI